MDELAGEGGDGDVVPALLAYAVVGGGERRRAARQGLRGLDGERASSAVAGLGDRAVVAVCRRLSDPWDQTEV